MIVLSVVLALITVDFGPRNLSHAAKHLNRLPVSLNTPRLPDRSTIYQSDKRDQTYNIIAIRVEFVTDTLSTTTGDGNFDYEYSDTMDFDPPPHDKQYFDDHLTFLRFYWDRMSNGNLSIDWKIYPEADRAAYPLPKKMWEYNWNLDDEQLDRGLAELFRDAITSADTSEPSINWDEYNLVIIFHAGAGSEFDLGFTLTPHDIPSALMGLEDLQDQLDLEDGIPVDEGQSFITRGIILPETETHDGVQISIAGVMCSLFGHAIGLPGLYDNDEGNAVVGKWSLMDRGFGNYYGVIPGELDAWSRIYKNWIEPLDLSVGEWTVGTRGFTIPDTIVNQFETGRIRISANEYYLIECRNRDPERDSIAIATDRNGKKMIFKEDYTVDREDGFRVPIAIDNLDFDSPGSGILIWHVDERLRALIGESRFNSFDDRRGLDLEEADGAQDIGRNYPFLTPGWGTDYGVFEDAWYGDNEAYRSANDRYTVVFDNDSYPDSRSNSGAKTHITLDGFSRRDTIMTFNYARSFIQPGFPVNVSYGSDEFQLLDNFAIGNFDDDPFDEIIVFSREDGLLIFDGDGALLHTIQDDDLLSTTLNALTRPAVADINHDSRDDVITFLQSSQGTWHVAAVLSDDDEYFLRSLYDTFLTIHPPAFFSGRIIIGGSEEDHRIFVTYLTGTGVPQTDPRSKTLIFDSEFNMLGEYLQNESLGRSFSLGDSTSDKFVTVTGDSVTAYQDNLILFNEDHNLTNISGSALADFDGSGKQDLLLYTNPDARLSPEFWQFVIFNDIETNGLSDRNSHSTIPGLDNGPVGFIPVDVDEDGAYEIFGVINTSLIGVEINGVHSEGFPIDPGAIPGGVSATWIANSQFTVDLDNDGSFEHLFLAGSSLRMDAADSLSHIYQMSDLWLDCIRDDGFRLPGFPVHISPLDAFSHELCQLDDDSNLEYVYFSRDSLNVIEIPAADPVVWWGSRYRDRQNRNAIWEPASSHTPGASAPLMPLNLCYNWPNPAREQTVIRYFLNFPASIKVDIFDITGEKVTTLVGPSTANFHHEIPWNTSKVPRGGYFAFVEAKNGGRTETKLVKIAVIK